MRNQPKYWGMSGASGSGPLQGLGGAAAAVALLVGLAILAFFFR